MNHRPVVSLILVSLTYLPYLPCVHSLAFGDRLALMCKRRDAGYQRGRETCSSGCSQRQLPCSKRTAVGQGAFLKIRMFWLVKSLKSCIGDSQFLGLVLVNVRRKIVCEERLTAFLLGSHLLTAVDEEEVPSTMYRYSLSSAGRCPGQRC